MIISHKLKVIYIKLSKVAGTSFEIALSKYCGPNDIITPLMLTDERTRVSLGFYGAQNYIDIDIQKSKFYNHISAREIKSLTADCWDNYLKIATIRCPYDMYISRYYFCTKGVGSFEQFVVMDNRVLDRVCSLHNENGEVLADFLIRYEYINEDLKILEEKINCPGLLKTFQNIISKGNRRPQTGTSSCEMYFKYPNAKLIIDEKCQQYANKYELFKQYWPQYKSVLEQAIIKYSR